MSNFPDFTSHRYEVISELGANRGAGRVAYLARQIDSGHSVVIKEFQFAQGASWDGHKAIDREVKILQQLKHPNIPRYLTSFETDRTSCIVQEYIDGKPLSAIISNQQLYTPEIVVWNTILGFKYTEKAKNVRWISRSKTCSNRSNYAFDNCMWHLCLSFIFFMFAQYLVLNYFAINVSSSNLISVISDC